MAASLDAAGTALGCMGLAGFAFIMWFALPNHNPTLVMIAALAVWMVLALVLWKIRKTRLFGRRFRPLR